MPVTLEQERLLVAVATEINKAMKAQGIKRKELAKRLGVTKGCISHYLCGERNMTLRTLADIFAAINCKATIRAEVQRG